MTLKRPCFAKALRVLICLSGISILAGCLAEEPVAQKPTVTATITKDDGSGRGIELKKLLQMADNVDQLSCSEINIASLQATGMRLISTSAGVQADAQTRVIAAAVAQRAIPKIERAEQCHCDRGQAMLGYEIYERRNLLQRNRLNRQINPDYAHLYPKDENGQPRFLEIGEPIRKSVLQELPPFSWPRYDDCGRSCKKARERTNAAALAEGKPEPFPNLEYPPKKPCR